METPSSISMEECARKVMWHAEILCKMFVQGETATKTI